MSPDDESRSHLHLQAASRRLDAARDNMEQGHLEDAAGAAYYAMYHAAHALIVADRKPPRTHRGLLHVLRDDYLGEDGLSEDDLERIAEAQHIREMSDYDPTYTPTREDVEALIEDAEAFLRVLRALLDVEKSG